MQQYLFGAIRNGFPGGICQFGAERQVPGAPAGLNRHGDLAARLGIDIAAAHGDWTGFGKGGLGTGTIGDGKLELILAGRDLPFVDQGDFEGGRVAGLDEFRALAEDRDLRLPGPVGIILAGALEIAVFVDDRRFPFVAFGGAVGVGAPAIDRITIDGVVGHDPLAEPAIDVHQAAGCLLGDIGGGLDEAGSGRAQIPVGEGLGDLGVVAGIGGGEIIAAGRGLRRLLGGQPPVWRAGVAEYLAVVEEILAGNPRMRLQDAFVEERRMAADRMIILVVFADGGFIGPEVAVGTARLPVAAAAVLAGGVARGIADKDAGIEIVDGPQRLLALRAPEVVFVGEIVDQ